MECTLFSSSAFKEPPCLTSQLSLGVGHRYKPLGDNFELCASTTSGLSNEKFLRLTQLVRRTDVSTPHTPEWDALCLAAVFPKSAPRDKLIVATLRWSVWASLWQTRTVCLNDVWLVKWKAFTVGAVVRRTNAATPHIPEWDALCLAVFPRSTPRSTSQLSLDLGNLD